MKRVQIQTTWLATRGVRKSERWFKARRGRRYMEEGHMKQENLGLGHAWMHSVDRCLVLLALETVDT